MSRAGPTNLDALGEIKEWCPYKEKFYKKYKIERNEWKDY